MRPTSKKQKIKYILTAAAFLLLAIFIVALLLREPALRREPKTEVTASPSPVTVATAAPESNAILVAGKSVEPDTDSFDLSGKTLSETDLAEIGQLRELTTLSLTGCGISDIHFLATLPRLRTLYLPDNRINDLTPLASLTELRTVYLDRNPLTDMTPLTALPNLSTLSLQGVTIADYVLEDLRAAMPNCRIFSDSVVEAARPISLGGAAFTEDVEVLDLSWRELTDISKLSYCLQLRELNLSGNPLSGLNTLSGLPKLTTLHLAAAGLEDDDLAFLQTLQKLTFLDIQDNPALTAKALEALDKAMPNCQVVHDAVYVTLELGGVTLTSDSTEIDLTARGLQSVGGLEDFQLLRRLILFGNEITDLSPLRELYALETLEAGYNRLTDIAPLTGHAALRRLDLSHNSLRDLSPLGSCTGLEELDLSYNQIDYLVYLYQCVNLRWVNLTGNPEITADQIRRLQEALPSCQIITDVDLSMPEPTPVPPSPTPEPALIPEFPDPIPLGIPETEP